MKAGPCEALPRGAGPAHILFWEGICFPDPFSILAVGEGDEREQVCRGHESGAGKTGR